MPDACVIVAAHPEAFHVTIPSKPPVSMRNRLPHGNICIPSLCCPRHPYKNLRQRGGILCGSCLVAYDGTRQARSSLGAPALYTPRGSGFCSSGSSLQRSSVPGTAESPLNRSLTPCDPFHRLSSMWSARPAAAHRTEWRRPFSCSHTPFNVDRFQASAPLDDPARHIKWTSLLFTRNAPMDRK